MSQNVHGLLHAATIVAQPMNAPRSFGDSPVNPCQNPGYGVGIKVRTVMVVLLRCAATMVAFLVVVIIRSAGQGVLAQQNLKRLRRL